MHLWSALLSEYLHFSAVISCVVSDGSCITRPPDEETRNNRQHNIPETMPDYRLSLASILRFEGQAKTNFLLPTGVEEDK